MENLKWYLEAWDYLEKSQPEHNPIQATLDTFEAVVLSHGFRVVKPRRSKHVLGINKSYIATKIYTVGTGDDADDIKIRIAFDGRICAPTGAIVIEHKYITVNRKDICVATLCR